MTDERLVRQAQSKATGANVHAVETLIALYRMMHAIGREREADDFERELRTFVQGDETVRSRQATSILLPVPSGRKPLSR